MNKEVSFNGIGYVAATFPVSAAAQEYLRTSHLNQKTGNVDINGKNLAVKLNADGTVGFGTGTAADKLLGIIIVYEQDGFASVQITGGRDDVPTAVALEAGVKGLAVDKDGKIVAVEGGRDVVVAKPSKAEELYASILL